MKRIKERREHLDITQRELAELVGVAPPTISMYESGKREPDQETLRKIADALKCRIDYLLEVDERPVEMSDFTFAMHGLERDLSERDKDLVRQLAQQLADAHKRKQ